MGKQQGMRSGTNNYTGAPTWYLSLSPPHQPKEVGIYQPFFFGLEISLRHFWDGGGPHLWAHQQLPPAKLLPSVSTCGLAAPLNRPGVVRRVLIEWSQRVSYQESWVIHQHSGLEGSINLCQLIIHQNSQSKRNVEHLRARSLSAGNPELPKKGCQRSRQS